MTRGRCMGLFTGGIPVTHTNFEEIKSNSNVDGNGLVTRWEGSPYNAREKMQFAGGSILPNGGITRAASFVPRAAGEAKIALALFFALFAFIAWDCGWRNLLIAWEFCVCFGFAAGSYI